MKSRNAVDNEVLRDVAKINNITCNAEDSVEEDSTEETEDAAEVEDQMEVTAESPIQRQKKKHVSTPTKKQSKKEESSQTKDQKTKKDSSQEQKTKKDSSQEQKTKKDSSQELIKNAPSPLFEQEEGKDQSSLNACLKTCTCAVCLLLRNFDTDSSRGLLNVLATIFSENKTKDTKMYLRLKPIPDEVPVVEITKDSGVFIPTAEKNKLKVDHSKNSKRMLMETLFVIYGQDPFKSLPIAVRGNKPGSYAIEQHIITAVLGFVNRNVAGTQKLSEVDCVKTINKRCNNYFNRHDKKSKCERPSKEEPLVEDSGSEDCVEKRPRLDSIPAEEMEANFPEKENTETSAVSDIPEKDNQQWQSCATDAVVTDPIPKTPTKTSPKPSVTSQNSGKTFLSLNYSPGKAKPLTEIQSPTLPPPPPYQQPTSAAPPHHQHQYTSYGNYPAPPCPPGQYPPNPPSDHFYDYNNHYYPSSGQYSLVPPSQIPHPPSGQYAPNQYSHSGQYPPSQYAPTQYPLSQFGPPPQYPTAR